MKYITYPKIKSIGYTGTENLLDGDIVITPKVDGSNVSIWITHEYPCIRMGKRTSWLNYKMDGGCLDGSMFNPFCEWVIANADKFKQLPVGTVLWGEMAQNQNKLRYQTKYPFIMFDSAYYADDTMEFNYWETTKRFADQIGVPMVPTIYEGPGANWTPLKLKELLDGRDSFMGGCLEEGIVIKGYGRKTRFDEPLFVKLVSDEFKESINQKKTSVALTMGEWAADIFFNKPRLRKAIQKLKEAQEWDESNGKKNIGKLIGAVTKDIYDEAYQEISDEAAKRAWKEVGRTVASKVAPTLDEIMLEDLEHLEMTIG